MRARAVKLVNAIHDDGEYLMGPARPEMVARGGPTRVVEMIGLQLCC
jgi:hypothetical protein